MNISDTDKLFTCSFFITSEAAQNRTTEWTIKARFLWTYTKYRQHKTR